MRQCSDGTRRVCPAERCANQIRFRPATQDDRAGAARLRQRRTLHLPRSAATVAAVHQAEQHMAENSLRPRRLCAAIALALSVSPGLFAATITVSWPTCTFPDAVRSANTDSAVGGCTAGAGDDVLELPSEAYFNSIPVPAITQNLIIHGQGLGISKLSCEGGGRPITIGADGFQPQVQLTQFGVEFCSHSGSNGADGGGGAAGMGGAVLIYDGNVTLDQMTFNSLSASGGGTAADAQTGGGGGGGLRSAGGAPGSPGGSSTATDLGSGGGGGANASVAAAINGGAAGGPNGGAGGLENVPPTAGGFGGGGGGGASTSAPFSQSGAGGGFGGGGGGGGAASSSLAGSSAGSGGPGGFGAGGGAGGASATGVGGGGGDGGFGGGGGGFGFSEGPFSPISGSGGFGGTNGIGVNGGSGASLGGAVFVRAGTVSIRNTTFSNSAAAGASPGLKLGGAIFAVDAAAVNTHVSNGGSAQGLPAVLPAVTGCAVSFSNSTAASAGATDTNNVNVYGVSQSLLTGPCVDIFANGFE
jgi:hypothetical protein